MNRLSALFAATLVVCLAAPAVATPTNYLVQGPAPATYAPLVGGTDFTTQFSDPDGSYVTVPIPAGYDFRWYGTPVTEVYVQANGFITFDSTSSSACVSGCHYGSPLPISSGSFAPLNSLYVWWSDVEVVSGTSHLSYGMEQVGSQQIFTIDLHGMPEWLIPSSNWSAKVRLYPGGSKIEVVYGAMQNPGSYSSDAVAGLQNGQSGASALYAVGLACSTSSSLCSASAFPSNSAITYVYADKPDLDWGSAQITSVAAGPGVGDPVAVSVGATVRNDGTQDAGPFDMQLYLSSTPSVDATSTLLATASNTLGLADYGGSEAESFSGTFARPATGKYYLVVVADPVTDGGVGAVDETDEGNNSTALVVYMGTDLTGSVSAPANGDVGGQVPVQISIINQGVDMPPGPFAYKLYMSTDATLDQNDAVVATGTVQPTDLPLNQTLSIDIPANIPAQDFYWILAIDPTDPQNPNGAIVEADETNDVLVTTSPTHVNVPDLTVTDLQVLSLESPHAPVSRAFFGEDVRVRVTVANIGAATAHNAVLGIFLSGGIGAAHIGLNDELLDSETLSILPPGASQTLDLLLTVPTADTTRNPPVLWTAGDFYFGAIIDTQLLIGESNETNNVKSDGPIAIRTPAVDFTPVELDVPSQAAVGEVVAVQRVIRNIGNRGNTGAGEPACPYRYYLSANSNITTEDIPLQIITGGNPEDQGTVRLDIGADSRATELVQLPASLSPGTYHLGILVNPDASIDEIDLTNDGLDGSVPVTIAAGQLTITTADLPDAVAGVGYSVQLASRGAANPTWTLASGSILPEGLSLSSDGLLSGTPGAPDTKAFVVEVSGGGFTARATLVLSVRELGGPLQVLTANLPSAVAGQGYSQKLAAVGGVAPYRWSLVGGSLPTGLVLDADGTVHTTGNQKVGDVTGVPYTFAILLSDASGATSGAQVSLRVIGTDALRITTEALPGGLVGKTYPVSGDPTIEVDPTHVSQPCTFSVTAGQLPPGLDLKNESANAEIKGQPSVPGLYAFTITAVDSAGRQDVHDYAISIEPSEVSLATLPLGPVKPGAAYEADLSSLALHAVWSVYSGELPPGLSLDAAGHISGSCDASATPGSYAFIVQAAQRNGQQGLVAESITVLNTQTREIPKASGCSSSSGGTMLLALAPVLMLLSRRRRAAGLAVVAAAAIVPGLAHASYTVTSSSNSYVAINGGQPITSGNGSSSNLTLPFPLRVFGQTYNSVAVGTSGYLALTGQADSTAPSFSGTPVIAVWGDNLTIGASKLVYVVNGVTPNRELVIQWTDADNTTDLSSGVQTHFDFRVRLHESGNIDFEYGAQGATGSATAAIAGISDGANNTAIALSCSGGFSHCNQAAWPTNTRVTFVPGTDLAIQSLTTAGLAYQNTSTNLTATVANPGGQRVASTKVRFYLSTNTVFGDADDQPVGELDNIALNAGAASSVNFSYPVGNLAPGSYFFFATIDPDNAVAEDDEGNNTYGPARLDVSRPQPDLVVSSVAVASHSAAPGGPLSVTVKLKNISNSDATSVAFAIYLSSNAVISQADTQLATGSIPSLAAGALSTQQVSVTVPAGTLSGPYYVGAIVNPALTIDESNALNDANFDATVVQVASDVLALNVPVGGALPATTSAAIYQYAFGASGGDGHYTFSATTALPPGLALSSSGVLSGRPTQPQDTPYAFTIAVADGSGHSASAQYALQVASGQAPLTILTAQLIAGQFAEPYTQALSAAGGVPPYSWTLGATGTLPSGMVLAPDGTLEGVPRQAGSFTFAVQVHDSAATAHTSNTSLTLEVNGEIGRLRVASPALPDATLDSPYQAALSVSGGAGSYVWYFPYCPDAAPAACGVTRFPLVPTDGNPTLSPDLPRGLYFSCDTSGQVFLTSAPPNIAPGEPGGTPCYNPDLPADAPNVPVEAGIYAIPALIVDAAQNQVQVVFSVRVGQGQGLSIATAHAPDALYGVPYQFQLQANSPASRGPLHWSLACSERDGSGNPLSPCPEALPPGLALQDDGHITGTPTGSASKGDLSFTFLVRASDDEGRVDVRALAITARAPAPTPASGCTSVDGPELLLSLLPLAALLRRRRTHAS